MTDTLSVVQGEARTRSALATQFDVIHALVLHDIKSRYFGNGLGYIVTILWPAAHLAVLMLIFVVTGRPVPYGQSKILYITTGVYPYIVWNYISRFTMMGTSSNKGYLQYPIISLLDLVFSRVLLEINTSFIILFWLIVLFYILDEPMMPHNPAQAAVGVAAAISIGVGFGVLGGVIASAFPLFNLFYILILITCWITSGVALNPELLPVNIGDLFAWNPLLHCVEMIRTSYYIDYPHRLLDIRYTFEVGFVSFTLGLILDRVLRRYAL